MEITCTRGDFFCLIKRETENRMIFLLCDFSIFVVVVEFLLPYKRFICGYRKIQEIFLFHFTLFPEMVTFCKTVV